MLPSSPFSFIVRQECRGLAMEDLTDRKWRQRFRSALVVSRKQKQELGEKKERNNTFRDLNYEVTVALPVNDIITEPFWLHYPVPPARPHPSHPLARARLAGLTASAPLVQFYPTDERCWRNARTDGTALAALRKSRPDTYAKVVRKAAGSVYLTALEGADAIGGNKGQQLYVKEKFVKSFKAGGGYATCKYNDLNVQPAQHVAKTKYTLNTACSVSRRCIVKTEMYSSLTIPSPPPSPFPARQTKV